MKKLMDMIGMTAGGYLGWMLGMPMGYFMAFVVSMVGTGFGMWGIRKLTRGVMP